MAPSSNAIATTQPQTSASLPKPHEVVIQDAIPADAEAIAKIGATTFANSFGYSMPAEHLQAYLASAYTPTAISKELANKQNQFFVARLNSAHAGDNGKVVGFIQMKLGTTEGCIPSNVPLCELHRIYVSVDQVGGGIGQLMMERGLKWARNRLLGSELLGGATVVGNEGAEGQKAGVWLGVWEENVKAERFYRRWGFERVGTHDFTTGDTRQTDSVMIKWLWRNQSVE